MVWGAVFLAVQVPGRFQIVSEVPGSSTTALRSSGVGAFFFVSRFLSGFWGGGFSGSCGFDCSVQSNFSQMGVHWLM